MKIFKKEKITNDRNVRKKLYRNNPPHYDNSRRSRKVYRDNRDFDDDYYDDYDDYDEYNYYDRVGSNDEYETREYNSGKYDRYETKKITRPRNIDDDVYYYEDEYEYYDNEDYNRRRLENINRNKKINHPQKKSGCSSFAFGCFIIFVILFAILLALIAAALGGIKPLFSFLFSLIERILH